MAEPSRATVKRLFAVSGNRCAFPGCSVSLVEPTSGKVTGRICHIKAQSPSGPRYDPDQSEEERHAFDNLVLMCPIHKMAHDLARTDVELREVLAAPGHVVLIGGAGCGKTTVLRLVATVLAQQDLPLAQAELALGPDLTPGTRYPIPVFVALRDFEHACQVQPSTYRRDVESLLRSMCEYRKLPCRRGVHSVLFGRWRRGGRDMKSIRHDRTDHRARRSDRSRAGRRRDAGGWQGELQDRAAG